jgi:tryptophan 7-halogenase
MNGRVRTVIIVGGGAAGWLTAARLAARFRGSSDGPKIVLVESSTIGTIGVGEGTWPTMRNTLRKAGIGETEFLRASDAAFKQGAKFLLWTDGSDRDGYYHPLNPPQGAPLINLSPHWQRRSTREDIAFADCVDFQSALCEAGLAPKAITTPEYAAVANYAYHLDAGKFATLLRNHAVDKLGVIHLIDDVIEVVQSENGDVASLKLQRSGTLTGDFFIDCTGFAALLLEKTYRVPFKDCADTLFVDSAIAVQVPYECDDAPVACHTLSVAQAAGWIWDIGLPTRRGVGHVYSSRHLNDEEAEAQLARYLGHPVDRLTPRRIKIRAGHRETLWVRNCVAIGLSAGFLEPLEASALMLIEHSVDFICERLPVERDVMDKVARQFNDAFAHHWERIIEFLKLHYVLTKREDTAFWRDNRDSTTVPDGLKDRLALWRHLPPGPQDFTHQPEVFSWPSYQYILHGMRFDANYAHLPHVPAEVHAAERWFDAARHAKMKSLAEMPKHRDLLNRVRDYGLQAL